MAAVTRRRSSIIGGQPSNNPLTVVAAGTGDHQQSHLTETEMMRIALLQALKDYRDLSDIETDTLQAREENAQYYNTASDHILQQIKVIDERNLESASHSLHKIAYDDHCGGEAMLLEYMDYSSHAIDQSVEMIKERIVNYRAEFRNARSTASLIDDALKVNYENLKGTYMTLLKEVDKRGEGNDKQWVQFENECRQWQVKQMNQIVEKYQGPDCGLTQKYKQLRKRVSKRLGNFSESVLSAAAAQLKDSGMDLRSIHRRAVFKSIKWKTRTQHSLEQWLSETVGELEEMYMGQVEKYNALLLDIRQHIYSLELYKIKLDQLSPLYKLVAPQYIPAQINKRNYFCALIRGIAPPTSDELKAYGTLAPRPPLSQIPQACESYGAQKCPAWSPTLGTRMFELARRTGVTNEEFVQQLLDLLYDLPDNDSMLDQFTLTYNLYNRLGANI